MNTRPKECCEPTTRQCSRCKVVYPLSSFHKDRAQSSGLSFKCKKCSNQVAEESKKHHPQKTFARQAVRNAFLRGELTRLPCEKCGEGKAEAHHHKGYDPAHWLDVQWLCKGHHYTAHHSERKSCQFCKRDFVASAQTRFCSPKCRYSHTYKLKTTS